MYRRLIKPYHAELDQRDLSSGRKPKPFTIPNEHLPAAQ